MTDQAAGSAVLRYAAFTDVPDGGNPAGVVLEADGMTDEQMLAIAARVGYSETTFLRMRQQALGAIREYDVRYFSPEAEVSFCGHATIAAAVALAERQGVGDLLFHLGVGEVPIKTRDGGAGNVTATLTSVAPRVEEIAHSDLGIALTALGWDEEELDPDLPPRISYAGARHLILAARTRDRLANLDYDFDALKAFMLDRDLTTVDLVWRSDDRTYYARNPFPVGGVVEDPATGAAAAAFGAYLRTLGAVTAPTRITILQGHDMGRPSELLVDLEAGREEVQVTGRAVAITGGTGV